MRRARALLALVLILSVFIPPQTGQAGNPLQDDAARREAAALLARMTPEEKIGQLFLISFKGTDVSKGSQISDLVTRNHIGGVVLRAENDNFTSPETAAADAHNLINALQQQVWDAYQDAADVPSHYAPLFVGISQEGDLYPNDQLFNSLTALPDEMAIGATWNPALSREVGTVMGSELSALGFNLLLGPSLDVQEEVPAEGSDDLGTRTFGGDPYWVGVMGQSYIEGLHTGSQGKLAVIAKHFPGRGSSDRPPEEEVATVRKSLEQLKQIELAPFFAVTANAGTAKSTDGLLVSHIRYQGFQNNIRATTSPVSFDRAALDLILKLPEFTAWRNNGGMMVSDDLGSPALRRFYETTGQTFDARQVARNAFLAGNDLLYLNNFTADANTDAYTTIVRTLSLFVARYREDRAFAERVDASATRILTLKFRLYGTFALKNILAPASGLQNVGTSQQVTFEIARQSATLLSPGPEEMESVLPRPPGANDRIVFITDVRSARQCSRCPDQVALAQDALQSAVLRLYGPQAGGQVFASRMSSYSFSDLQNMLNGTTTEVTPVEQDLRQAAWIVFASLKLDRTRMESTALRRFLSERPDLFRNKRVIAFSFNAPYYLDATDIAKLTAYYALYSKVPAFVDVAARILFQELTPPGASPVSVPGVGYNLISITSPDPGQVIPLYLDIPELPPSSSAPAPTPLPTPVPVFKVGDGLPLRTGVIVDHNRNPVPDGTVVRFLFTVGGDTGTVQQIETTTTAGVARAAYRIQSSGLLEVRVVSDPAITSQLLRMDVSEQGGVITPISPTIEPTITPTPTLTVTPTVTPTSTPAPLPPSRPGTSDWLLSMVVIWIGAAGIFLVGQQRLSTRWGFRWAMSASVGGLLGYLYFAMMRLLHEDETRGVLTNRILLGTLIGLFVGLGVGLLWKTWLGSRARSQAEKPPTGPRSSTGPKSPAG